MYRLIPLLLGLAATQVAAQDSARLDAVAERGREVMPFALEQTFHEFTPNAEGGIQRVVAKRPDASEQIRLIRDHLRSLAQTLSQGDFSGPARIHGDTMPGLAELRAAPPGQVEYRYRELPDGAEITYRAQSPQLIAAIHHYFAAQLDDHARHVRHHRP